MLFPVFCHLAFSIDFHYGGFCSVWAPVVMETPWRHDGDWTPLLCQTRATREKAPNHFHFHEVKTFFSSHAWRGRVVLAVHFQCLSLFNHIFSLFRLVPVTFYSLFLWLWLFLCHLLLQCQCYPCLSMLSHESYIQHMLYMLCPCWDNQLLCATL